MSPGQVVRSTSEANMVQLSINTIRTLSIDAVQQAKSGHPGTSMALAPSERDRLAFSRMGD